MNYMYLLNNLWWEPQDYTDFHKISVSILCNLVVLYTDIHTTLSKYNYTNLNAKNSENRAKIFFSYLSAHPNDLKYFIAILADV